jgi:signal transduction histidine kinase/ActR/RegA family two-component response regulator
MTTQLISPVGPSEGERAFGAVAITIDIGGLARRETATLWVQPDGSYLNLPGMPHRSGSAFSDFAGLERLFDQRKIVLWESADEQLIWVPMFRTDDNKPLWVGRRVNRQPLEEFQNALTLRVLGIILLLVVTIWLVARWFARRAERFGTSLLDGLKRMLERDEAVVFPWHGTRELEELGDRLTRLSQSHARNTRNLRAHARELEQSNRYKSEFLANVSHELRTPLNSILLLSKLLAEDGKDLSQERRQQARVINEAGQDLRALIENILDLSRIEAGRLQVHVEEIDLTQLLGDLRELMRPQFEAKGLTLELEVSAGAPPRIQSDGDKIRQILKNFLANSVKFTHSGGARVQLSAMQQPYAVKLAVTDTGIGIAKEKQEIIFEAFKQADGSTNRRYGGTGLGLTISRELADLLGGEIRVRSIPEQGASFELLLPADCGCIAPKVMHAASAHREEPAAAEPEPASIDFHGRRLLLLDNDVRRLLRLTPMLEEWGMEVVAVGDSDEALEALDERPFDVALIDFEMPGLDACATIENMRSHKAHGELAVIALLRDQGETRRFNAIEAGIDDFVSAEAGALELGETIDRHLPAIESAR